MLKRPAFSGWLLVAFISLSLFHILPCAAQDQELPSMAPVNPAFAARHLQGYIGGEHAAGLIPEPFDISGVPQPDKRSPQLVSLPASYDLRAQGKLTDIRNQGGCGSCWAFASIGSLESSLLPAESVDFSENNLKNLSGFSLGACDGGNRGMSTAYLVRWGGPVAETDDPYSAVSDASPAGRTVQKHVQEVIFLPNRTGSLDNEAIKQAITTYGAVYTTYYHSDSYFKSATAGYYYNGSSQSNHAVCIVGWDDNYAASNFQTTPPGNGAFLMRNSWGTWWGQSGYFWMSYYDTMLGKTENAVFRAEANTNYDQIYQYDPLGWVSNTGYSSTTGWFANVFTASSTSNIAAASWYTPAPNSSYTLYVYTNVTTSPVNASSLQATVTGTLATAGYHTVQLPSTVPIQAGQKFSVVVKLTTPGYTYPICLESAYAGYSDDATAAPGQSYMSSNGTSWTDVAEYWANTNVCLKAFTLDSGTPTPGPGTLSVSSSALSSSGVEGGPFTPSSITYTLRNTGESSLDWSATPNKPWIGVSSSAGTLAAGAQATVTVSIISAANSLDVGSYMGSVAFENVTNAYGSTSRSVALAVSSPANPGVLSVLQTAALTFAGAAGGPFSPGSQAYTVRNTGQAAISWTVSSARTWVSLTPASGILAPGASTNVIVSITSRAQTLAPAVYSDLLTFTNTTNGQGNTTRRLSLNVSAAGSYKVARTGYDWIQPASVTRALLTDNSVSVGLALPFAFNYYGKNYTVLYIGSNGLLGFTYQGMTSPNNVDIPYGGWPNYAIYPYWDDLNPAAGGLVWAAMVGSAPNRKVVVTWYGVPVRYAPATKLTFQAILCEGSNDIIFQYRNVGTGTYSAGVRATIGIENQAGTQACKFSYNSKSLTNGLALRFSTH